MIAEGWADHPGGIQLWAQDGHLGRVLPECPSGDKLGAGWPATTRLATGCLATSAAPSWADSGTFILTDTLHNTFTELIGSNKTT